METHKFSIFPLLVLFLFPALSHTQELRRLDNITDQQSLLIFKSHITDDPFGVLQTWNPNTSFCKWKGVTCNITKQRVTGLRLEGLKFAGTLAPYIANLSFLSILNLQNNSFYGNLPHELGQLFQLQTLSLGSNLIQGAIPSSLSLCTRLVTLDLSDNRLEGTIPHELGRLLKLQVLRLGDNSIIGTIPSSLGNLSSITNLLLLSNKLYGSIPEELGYLPFLINLEIDENNITGEIPSSLLNSSSLIMLTMTLNRLSGILPSDMFFRLSSLTTLFMGGNNFTGSIPLSIMNASKLERIDLSVNNFVGKIPLLSNLPNIQVMNLGNNQLVSDGEDGLNFLTSLAHSTHLQVFSLATNRLTGKLPSSIGNLSRELSLLVMGDNQLEGSIPAEISNLVGLTMISLEYNLFTGNIPPSIGNLPILQNLYLHKNRFSGQIPESLGNLTQLYEMSLSGNNLTGIIPSSLGNFQHLQVLDLSVNRLNGKIPIEIFSIPSLGKVLNLSWNSLTGMVPTDIGKLKMTQGIDFSKNRLSGDIPISIGGCLSLLVLDLSTNFFQGPIPNSLTELKGIEFIDLSSNNLSGKIPLSLQSFQFLQLLNLSMNQLQGEVPSEGIFRNSTAVSLIGNPELCGGVPKLELPKCSVPIKHSSRSNVKLIIGLVIGLAAFGLLSSLFLLLLRKRILGKPQANDEVVSFEGPHGFYTYHDLRIATDNFSSDNLIGEGSFGFVYKGVLRDGTPAAIKVFNMEQHKALKSFLAECATLRNVRHRNLVRIMSACSSSDFKALVLQLMSNGSLEHWLHKTNGSQLEGRRWLDTKQRLEIAIDVASAMEYLHHDCETPVVHCDLKPSNILLDDNKMAHVADFGLARMILVNSNERPLSSTLGLRGSVGYIAPEYGLGGGVSTKGDVYSYGILLLEMFTGNKSTDEMFTGELNLQKWVSMALPHRIMDIVDPKLVENDLESIKGCWVSVMEIGLMCTSNSPDNRPTMRDVSAMIRRSKNELMN